MPLRAQVCLVGGGPVLATGQTCALRRAQVCSQGEEEMFVSLRLQAATDGA